MFVYRSHTHLLIFCKENKHFLLYIFIFLIGIHSMQGWTATTRNELCFTQDSDFTQALAHNFVRIAFRIQTKGFSDILNDQRAPSLKQSANSGYFGKSLISYNRTLYPRVGPELLRIHSTHFPETFHDDKTLLKKQKCQQRIIRKSPVGPFLIQLNM